VAEATIEANASPPLGARDNQEWSEQPLGASSTIDSNDANADDDDQGFNHKAWVEQATQAKSLARQRSPKARGQQASSKGHAKRKGSAGVYPVAPAEEEGENWQARWLAEDHDGRHHGASGRHIQGTRRGSRASSQRYMATAEEDRQDEAERDADTGAAAQVGRRRARSIRPSVQEEVEADGRRRGADASSDVQRPSGGATRRKRTGSTKWEDTEERGVRRDASLEGLRRMSTGPVRRQEGHQRRRSAADSYRDEPEEGDEQLQEQALAADEGRARSRRATNSTAVEDGDLYSDSKTQARIGSELRRVRSLTPGGRRTRSGLAEAEADEVDEDRTSRPSAPGRTKSSRRQRSQGGDADNAEDSSIDEDYL
jgi:hypothetical protein